MKIKEKLKEMIVLCGDNITAEDVSEEVNLIDDLGFDSVEFITLIVEIEKGFDIEFQDEDLSIVTMSSYSALSELINKMLIAKEKRDEMV